MMSAETLTADELLDELRACREQITGGVDASARAAQLIREARDTNLVEVPALAEAFGVTAGRIYQYVAPAMRDD